MPSCKQAKLDFGHLLPGLSAGNAGCWAAIRSFISTIAGGKPANAKVNTPCQEIKNAYGSTYEVEVFASSISRSEDDLSEVIAVAMVQLRGSFLEFLKSFEF